MNEAPAIKRQTNWLVAIVFFLVYGIVAVIPGYVFFTQRAGASDYPIFPLLGLYAFFLLWAQIMIGTNMGILRRNLGLPWIQTFHEWEGGTTLLFALLHPLFAYLVLGGPLGVFKAYQGSTVYILTGYLALTLLLVTVLTAAFRKIPWLVSRWHTIHYLNYIIFLLVWIHSWNLGSDVQSTGLRYLWIFFGVTAFASFAARMWRKKIKPRLAGATATTPNVPQR